ncbi:MAG: type I secretion system permease/ATPase [Deltaproteobacteria bacterium]|nr:type I secretion system permease/ATPase [Deltaproteobacteria bacterium]
MSKAPSFQKAQEKASPSVIGNANGSRHPGADTVRPDTIPSLLASLEILLRLKGVSMSLDSLLASLPVGRGGLFPPGLCVRAAEQAGLNAKIVSRPAISKINRLTLPCILVLKNGDGCVLIGMDGKQAEVLFPETPGSSSNVALETLQDQYAGKAIFVSPKERLDGRTREIKFSRTPGWFWGTIARFMPIYKHVVLGSIVINVLGIAGPLFTMNVYDRVVPNNALETLWVLALGVAIAYGFDFMLKNLRGYFVDLAGKNADVVIASKLMQHVMSIRMDHKPESTGSLANSLREFESLREFFSSTTLISLVDFPFLCIFIALVAYIGGPIAYAPIVAVPVVILVGLCIQYPFKKYIEAGFREGAQKNALLVEAINGLETVKTSLAEGQIQRRWETIIGLNSKSSHKAKALATFSMTFSQFAAQCVSVIVIVWGVYRIGQGELTMGGLIACNILVGRAMAPLGAVAAMLTRLQQSRVALKSLNQVMKIPGERPPDKEYVRYEGLGRSISFEKVTFRYPNGEVAALDNVNLLVRPGEKVGIIGPMGSGKSTLGRLILGLYTPQEGSVKVGGVDVRQLDVAELRKRIGYVSQDNYLFYGSIKDNIAFGAPFADDASILRAATIAGVMDFIRTHPAGFGLQVGERGMNLSGGQRQSVVIARALIQDPDILILDEPSSSMDRGVEALLIARLASVTKDKTLLLISHRSSMLSLVERLIVMERGKILADGPRDKVMELLREGKIQFRI